MSAESYEFLLKFTENHQPLWDITADGIEFCTASIDCDQCSAKTECWDYSTIVMPTITEDEKQQFIEDYPERNV